MRDDRTTIRRRPHMRRGQTAPYRGAKATLWVAVGWCVLSLSAPALAKNPDCEQDVDDDELCDVWELAMLGSLEFDAGDDPDGDGLDNSHEFQWGTHPLEWDTDDDGLPDGVELAGVGDADPSSQTNPLAFDTDGDGLGDGEEDRSRNGMVDPFETDPTLIDTDGDSIDDAAEWGTPGLPPRDFDGDGIPDALDDDSDGDGLPDADEAGDGVVWTKPTDLDGDGLPDFLDDDSDGDGIPDPVEFAGDADLDGVPDPDADGDGIPNHRDRDSDDDGKDDAIEGTGDNDADGIPNYLDDDDEHEFSPTEPPDAGSGPIGGSTDPGAEPVGEPPGGGAAPPTAPPLPDAPPLVLPPPDDDDDWDGDGLSNLAELALGTDPRAADTDGDSIRDDVEIGSDFAPYDTDGDGFLDALDLDSDGDAIPDRWEAGDGGTTPRDTDGDDTPDFRDLDSDSDGLLDREEVTETMTDPYRSDTDGGSVSDGEEVWRGSDPNDPDDDLLREEPPLSYDPFAGANLQGGVGACSAVPSPSHAPWVWLVMMLGLVTLRRRRGVILTMATADDGPASEPNSSGSAWVRWGLVLCTAFGGLAASRSHAQTLDGRTVNLTADGTGILGTPTATTLGRFRYAAGVSTEFVQDPLVIARDGRLVQRVIGSRVDVTTHGAFGPLEWLDVGFDLPSTVFASGRHLDQRAIGSANLGDLRLWTKAQALTMARHGLDLGATVTLGLPTGSDAELTGAGAVTVAGELLLGGTVGPVSIHGALGYRVLPRRTLLDLTVDDILTYSVAARWDIGVAGLSLDAAISGATAAFSPFASTTQTNLEGIVGVHWRAWRGLAVRGGVGGGMLSGPGTPVVRAFIGLSWVAPKPEPVLPDEPEPEAPDTDGDGLADDVDRCPTEPEDFDHIDDDDGCPEHDRDEDGIEDRSDQCPDEMEDEDGFEDADGCPDRDNDHDGVPDIDDRCPLEAGVASDDDTKHGCPGEALVQVDKAGMRIEILDESLVHFDWNQARIPTKYRTMLKQVVAVMNAHPEIRRVRIEGHASWTGPAAINKALSQRRADAVRGQLISLGVAPARLVAVGFGFERLKVKKKGPRYNWQNRRVEFVIETLDR